MGTSGFGNYAHVLHNPYFWRALRNTVVLVLVVVHVEMLLATEAEKAAAVMDETD